MNIQNRLQYFFKGFIIINLIWIILSKAVNMNILPLPFEVYKNLFTMNFSDLYIHFTYSFMRIFLGIAISLILGVFIGIISYYSKTLDNIIAPLVYFTYPIPKISLLPILMLTLGIKEKSKIVMIVLIVIFQVIITTRDSIKNIPKEIFYPLKCLGASRFQILKEVLFPSILSEIFTSIRLALGTAISVLFFTETYGTRYGMGYFIMDSWMKIDYISMYTGIVLISILGFILFTLVDLLEQYFCRWR